MRFPGTGMMHLVTFLERCRSFFSLTKPSSCPDDRPIRRIYEPNVPRVGHSPAGVLDHIEMPFARLRDL